MSPSDEPTIAFYGAQGEPYAARAHGKSEHPRLAEFAGRLPPRGSVLDLGCGGGQDSLAFARRGLAVTAVDASSRIAAEAERMTGLSVRVLEFGLLDYAADFDGVWASASLHHVPASALPAIFPAIHRALKPGGWLYASFKRGKVDRRDRFGRLYCEMDDGQLRSLVADDSLWREARIDQAKGSGYDNEPTDWLMLTVQRA